MAGRHLSAYCWSRGRRDSASNRGASLGVGGAGMARSLLGASCGGRNRSGPVNTLKERLKRVYGRGLGWRGPPFQPPLGCW